MIITEEQSKHTLEEENAVLKEIINKLKSCENCEHSLERDTSKTVDTCGECDDNFSSWNIMINLINKPKAIYYVKPLDWDIIEVVKTEISTEYAIIDIVADIETDDDLGTKHQVYMFLANIDGISSISTHTEIKKLLDFGFKLIDKYELYSKYDICLCILPANDEAIQKYHKDKK